MMASSTPPVTIPSTLFDVYRQYKTSTAVVLKWLGDNEAIASQSGVTISQLQIAAESVCTNNIQVPEAIYRAFRESVAKRQKVTNWFMSAELSTGGEISQITSNHIHFTKKLEKAFLTLFPKGKGALPRGLIDKGGNGGASNESCNRFEMLSDMVSDLIQAPNIKEDEEDGEGPLGPSPRASEMEALTVSETSILGDDPLDSLLRIHLLLRELDSICDKVKSYWEQASDGTLPLPFAAWLTNAAYETTKRLCEELIDIDKDAQEHQDVYIGVVNRFNIVFTSCPLVSEYDDFTQGRGMTFPWIAIAHFKLERKGEQNSLAKHGWQDPIKCISSAYKDDDGVSFCKDLDAYKFILTSIGQLLRKENSESREAGFTPSDMNPLLSDISAFLENQSEHPNLSLVFGLHLLLETYRSFIWNTNAVSKINCRLQALRFAKDVKEMGQNALPHSCDPMVHAILMADTSCLDKYLAENRFDLYYQSPWTAGFHMCEILHYSIDTGLRLFNSEGRVGAVLHIYNALRQLKLIMAIPLLDDLCEMFRREIFLGSLPTENFSSHFRRFLGGTVQSEASQTLKNARRGRPVIGLPVRLPSARDYVKRLMPGEVSLFYKLYNDKFATTIDFWSRLYTGKHSTALPKSQLEGVLENVNCTPFTEPLAKLSAVVVEEFTGRLPVAGIKYHSIYVLCLQVLKDMATLKLREDGVEATTSDALGFTFVETLLVSIVDHQRSAPMSKLLPHLSSLRLARQAILNVFSDKNLSEFVWKF